MSALPASRDTPGELARTPAQRALDLVILASTLAIMISGIVLLLVPHSSARYTAAPPCANPRDAMAHDCYARVDASVDAITLPSRGKLSSNLPRVTLTWPAGVPATFSVIISQPTRDFYALRAAGTANVKIWEGRPTALYATAASLTGVRTNYNPYSIDDLLTAGGIGLVGMSVLLLLVHPALWLLPAKWRPTKRSALAYWWRGSANVAQTLKFTPLRVAIVVLICLNLLDIATSIHGGKTGFYERNPIAVAMVERWGAVGGFFGLKLPALIAILLAITKLPRRMAMVVATAGCAIMVYVVLSNAALEIFGVQLVG